MDLYVQHSVNDLHYPSHFVPLEKTGHKKKQKKDYRSGTGGILLTDQEREEDLYLRQEKRKRSTLGFIMC